MVHLTTIDPSPPSSSQNGLLARIKDNKKDQKDIRSLSASVAATTSVYGSAYALQDLPRHELPEHEMPREVAYQMIRDDLSLDGNPKMNLASFVTTYMEDEAEKLMTEAFPKNFIDYEEYPQTADIQNRCVNMLARLFHAPLNGEALGTSTVGSSEAIILAVLAMKRRWVEAQGPNPNPARRPNLIMSSAVQVCWEKAVRYLEVETRFVYCSRDRMVIDPEQAVALVDKDTIGICAILGTTYTGEYEDVKALNDLLVAKDLNVPIHVDAASGGFVAPFIKPDLVWDFRLERVVSINTSGHKYGLVYPGVGWAVWRSPEYLPKDLIFNVNYLGADQATFTLNFSKGASQVIGQYYQLIRLGRSGYFNIMSNLTSTADHLSGALQTAGFIILSKTGGAGLPLVAFRFATATDQDPPSSSSGPTKKLLRPLYDEFDLARQLRSRGWIVPAYTMAPHNEEMKLMRVVVRIDMTLARCDMLISDILMALNQLNALDAKDLDRAKLFLAEHGPHSVLPTRPKNPTHHQNHHHPNNKSTAGTTHGIC